MYYRMAALFISAVFTSSVALSPFSVFAQNDAVSPVVKPVSCPTLRSSISVGMRGEEVRALQEFLASRYGVATSSLVTGYFGPLTRSYVTRFQKENNLPQVGVLGPRTRAVVSALCGTGATVTEPRVQPGAGLSPLTCRVEVQPSRITQSQPVTITWSSSNAEYAQWDTGAREAATGTRAFSDIATTTLKTLTFFGKGTKVTCAVKITVVTGAPQSYSVPAGYGGGSQGVSPQIPVSPLAPVCPAIGWVEPVTPCAGVWVPTYGANTCQNGWQCVPSTQSNVQKKSDICASRPQIIPACDTAQIVRDADGCIASFICPSPTVPLLKPGAVCPAVQLAPVLCDGKLSMVTDANGCQTGWRCDAASESGPGLISPIETR